MTNYTKGVMKHPVFLSIWILILQDVIMEHIHPENKEVLRIFRK